MTDQPQQEQDLYNIVIVGDMNPKIHHPLWYEHISILTKEEASKVENLICTPPMSQFETERFTIICATNRWEIRTTSLEEFDRILSIAIVVFGTLNQTPVSLFGFNFNSVKQTKNANVAAFLGQKVSLLQLGLIAEGERSAEIKYIRIVDDCRITTILRSSPSGKQILLIGINFQYEVKDIVTDYTQFDLGPVLRARFEDVRSIATEQFEQIVQKLNEEL